MGGDSLKTWQRPKKQPAGSYATGEQPVENAHSALAPAASLICLLCPRMALLGAKSQVLGAQDSECVVERTAFSQSTLGEQ